MRNFELIATGIDVQPLLHQITTQPGLWNEVPIRSQYGNHQDTDDILLRYNHFDPEHDDVREAVVGNINCENYPAFSRLPAAIPLVLGLMARVQGVHLGRVFISRLPPEASIPPHTDRDPMTEQIYPGRKIPAVYYERYQLTLRRSIYNRSIQPGPPRSLTRTWMPRRCSGGSSCAGSRRSIGRRWPTTGPRLPRTPTTHSTTFTP